MTAKIDLRYKGDKDFPPEIKQLIEKHGGVIRHAEQAARVGTGFFGKVRKGDKAFTDTMKARVVAALSGEPMEGPIMRQDSLDLPDTCPQLITDLIKLKGSKKAAISALGTSDGPFYAVMRGQREMPPEWIVRAKAELGQPVIGAPRDAEAGHAESSVPPFVPWDGKSKGSFTTRPVGPHKSRTIKNVPQPILDLLNKHEGNLAEAARAVGLATGTALLNWMAPGKFTLLKQNKVHAAMHGQMPTAGPSMTEEYDKYSLGLAICMLKGTNYDRIADIADILNGRLVFRKNTSGGWIIIYKMATDDLPKFKKLALRDASEIVCP